MDLIEKISGIHGIEWIRLLYCYPEEIDDALQEIADNHKVVKYLDIPIQHASDKILKMMGRRGNSEVIKNTLAKLRASIPRLVLRTSLIVGFPEKMRRTLKFSMILYGNLNLKDLVCLPILRKKEHLHMI